VIVRIRKRAQPFVMIDKRPLENAKLGFKAKGLLAYLLSKPDNWQIWTSQLIKSSTDGRRSILTALRELERAGHAKLEAFHDADGRLHGRAWTIYEQPLAPARRKQRRIEKHKTALSASTENAFSRSSQNANVAKCATNNNDSLTRRTLTETSFLREEHPIPREYKALVDYYNERLAKKEGGWYRADRFTPSLGRALKLCGNDQRALREAIEAVADSRVNGYVPRTRSLVSLLFDYAEGKIKIAPKHYLGPDEQRQLRREKMEAS
jgi:hypothetical protein